MARFLPILLWLMMVIVSRNAYSGTVVLDHADAQIKLNSVASLVPDSDAQWTIEDFPRLDKEGVLLRGISAASARDSHGRRWLYMDIRNETSVEDWVIHLDNADLDRVDLMMLDRGKPIDRQVSGLAAPFANALYKTPGFALKISVPPGQRRKVALLIDDELSSGGVIMSASNFQKYALWQMLLTQLGVAALWLFAALSLLTFRQGFDLTHFFMLGFLSAMATFWTYYFQIPWQFFGLADKTNLISFSACVVMLLMGALHAIGFLDLKNTATGLERAYLAYFCCCLAFLVALPFIDESSARQLLTIGTLFTSVLNLIGAAYCQLHGTRWARLYIVAWSAPLLSLGLHTVQVLGVHLGDLFTGQILMGFSALASCLLLAAQFDRDRLKNLSGPATPAH